MPPRKKKPVNPDLQLVTQEELTRKRMADILHAAREVGRLAMEAYRVAKPVFDDLMADRRNRRRIKKKG